MATRAGNADRALLPQRQPEQAKNLYEEFAEALRRLGVTVATGVFGAMMSVELVNEGPVTILLDSDKTF